MSPMPVCPKGHTPEYFLVSLYAMSEEGELLPREDMILMNPDGSLSNNYYDGTTGITAEDKTEAEEQESVFCLECLSEAIWQH